jgi:DNA-binding FrmR family transcriptional regulator
VPRILDETDTAVTSPEYPLGVPCSGGREAKEAAMHGYTAGKDDLLKRLRRIEGQVRGLQRMVDEDAYCVDVLTQISAATKALEAVALGMLEEHLRHCVADAIATGGPQADDKITEAAAAVRRLVRS